MTRQPINMILYVALALFSVSANGAQAEDSSIPLPDDLKWESECVPEGLGVDPITFALYQLDARGQETVDIRNTFLNNDINRGEGSDNFEWDYLGSVHGNHRIVRSRLEYCDFDWPFGSIMILHREGDRFVLTGNASGGGRCVNDICDVKVKGDQILYTRLSTYGSFVDWVVDAYPELQPWYDRSSKRGLSYGSASFNGWFDVAANISDKGEIASTEILMWHPAEGSEDMRSIKADGLVAAVLSVLRQIDADKPEEFKENGIAFSPAVIKELLEADLRDDDTRPKSVEITEYKDAEYSRYRGYYWDYIGRVGDHHVVYLKVAGSDGGAFSGLYTVRQDGDVLEKVARIARQIGYKNEIETNAWYAKSLFVENSELTYTHHASTENLFKTLLECVPELAAYARSKDLSGLSEDECKGKLTWKVEIAADATVKQRSLVSYYPSYDMQYDRARRYFDEGILLPIDTAVACVSTIYAHDHSSTGTGIIDMNEHLKDMLMDILERTFPAGPGN